MAVHGPIPDFPTATNIPEAMKYTSGFAALLGIGVLIAMRNEAPVQPSAPTDQHSHALKERVKEGGPRGRDVAFGTTGVRKLSRQGVEKSSPSTADQWRMNIAACADAGQRRMMISEAMTDLCSESPIEALRLAESLNEDDGRCEAVIQALAGMAGTGAVEDALSRAETMISAEDLPLARAQIATKWSEVDAESAMAWASTVSDPMERDSLSESIASTWARTQPEKALHWLANAPDVPAWREIMISVSSEWARTAPEAALAWAKQQSADAPDGPDLERTVMLAWSEEDPVSASENLISGSHAMQLAVAERVASHLDLLNPQLANRWIARIEYPDVRERAEAALLSHSH